MRIHLLSYRVLSDLPRIRQASWMSDMVMTSSYTV